jgi:hypothetical protein
VNPVKQSFDALRRGLIAVTGMLFLVGMAPATAGAVAPAQPAFKITSTISPTHLIPGDESGKAIYAIRVVNSGAAATDGTPIVISDELPEGVTNNPAGGGLISTITLSDPAQAEYPCEEGAVSKCEYPDVLAPGSVLHVFIPVNVSATAPSPAVNKVTVSGGGVAEASAVESTPVTDEPAAFGFQSIDNYMTDANGSAFTQAGGHPYSYTAHFQLTQEPKGNSRESAPVRNPRVILAKLPKGLVVNPGATEVRCTEAQFEASVQTECPAASAVGLAYPALNLFGFANAGVVGPLYNLEPPPGAAAAFGFAPGGFALFIHIIGSVDASGDYVLTAAAKDIAVFGQISGLDVELWGNPTDPSHDERRGVCAFTTHEICEAEFQDSPLLTAPTACGQPSPFTVEVTPYQEREDVIEGSAPLTDPEGNPISVDGCNKLEFAPTISAQPTTNLADTPSGLDFNLHQDQNTTAEGLSPAAIRDVSVTLPQGMTLNASAANGLDSCSEDQIGYQPRDGKVRFSAAPQSCPDAAKVGSVEVSTPLLDHKLPGAVYVAKPYENPFGSLLAIYLAIEDQESGIVAKLAGKVTPDPQTGQLTARFTESPELPLEDVSLHFFQGPRAALKSPLICGTHTTTSDLTPYSTPEGENATPSDSFQTTVAATGSGACPGSEAEAPNALSFSAGTAAPEAGAFSPFLLRLARADGTQRITGIDTTLPPGLTGKLAGIPYCPEGAIAQAKSREAPNQGAVEQASPSCPAASEVGSITVGAGAGISPLYVSGHAYLAGPYKGAQLSLVTIVPAVAGPFDLGTVVTRVALDVDLYSAQIHAKSDPLPTIIDGIPLDVRSIALRLNRPDFTLNPTSCEATQITGTVTSATGQAAQLKNSFQVGGCKSLAFKPKLALSLEGATRRSGHPALKAVLRFPGKGTSANIARAQVGLPHSEFLDQGNIGTVCTQPQLKARSCPAGSIYGRAKAWTPLLDKPLEGPVYLGAGFGHNLPDLVADLNGQIRVLLHGKVDTTRDNGIRNTFEAVPDAPVSKFVLEMKGGKRRGLLVNSENICRTEQRASVRFSAQNGKVLQLHPRIANSCGKKGRAGKKKGGK